MAKYRYARDCSGMLRTNPRPITQRYYSAYLLVPLNSRDTKTTTEKKSGIHPYTTGNLVRTSIPEKNDFIRFFLFLKAILHRQTRTALYLLVKRKELFCKFVEETNLLSDAVEAKYPTIFCTTHRTCCCKLTNCAAPLNLGHENHDRENHDRENHDQENPYICKPSISTASLAEIWTPFYFSGGHFRLSLLNYPFHPTFSLSDRN